MRRDGYTLTPGRTVCVSNSSEIVIMMVIVIMMTVIAIVIAITIIRVMGVVMVSKFFYGVSWLLYESNPFIF